MLDREAWPLLGSTATYRLFMFTGARLLRLDYCEYPPSVLFETDILVDNLFTFLGGRLEARLG